MRFCIGVGCTLGLFFCLLLSPVLGQPFPNKKFGQEDKFRQLEEILPTPNDYRSAAGEPGPDYWQQKIDYNIDVTLNDQGSIDSRKRIDSLPQSVPTHTSLHLGSTGCQYLRARERCEQNADFPRHCGPYVDQGVALDPS